MTALDLRLALPATVAWIATAALIGLPSFFAVPVAIGLWIGAGTLCALWTARVVGPTSRQWLPVAAVAIAAAALCVTAVGAGMTSRAPAALVEAAESGRYVSVVATVSQTVGPATNQFDATIVEVDEARMSAPVVVFGAQTATRLALGSVVTLGGTLVATEAGDHASFLFFARGSPSVLERRRRGWGGPMAYASAFSR